MGDGQMIALGLCATGIFVSFLIIWCLRRISPGGWKNPLSILSGAIGLAFAGVVGYFIKELNPGAILGFYPVGLAYGAFCINATWAVETKDSKVSISYMVALGVATVLLLLLLLSEDFRNLLPM
jgi:hypothetical protein